MPFIGRGGSSPPPDTNQIPIWVRDRLCLYADLLLFWLVGESESELPVDLGAVGGLGFGEGCGDVAELLDERGDLFAGHGFGRLGAGCGELLLDLAPLVLDFGDPSGDDGGVGACV